MVVTETKREVRERRKELTSFEWVSWKEKEKVNGGDSYKMNGMCCC